MSILTEKSFPSQYPKDAVRVLKAMSFSKGKHIQIVGSSALRSQLYAGDYDAYEVVEGDYSSDEEALEHFVAEFKKILKDLLALPNTYIGDIKAGVIEDWRVIPKTGTYTFATAKKKIDSLLDAKVISPHEAKEALGVLKTRPTKLDTLLAKDVIKFHIIRWTPEEILAGYKTLRDGRRYTLEEAFHSPTITKVDVVALVDTRYTEFAIIYEFHNKGRPLNPDTVDPERSLKDSIAVLKAQGNLFKVVKRKFALAKLKNDYKGVQKYHAILNSDLGKLYVIYTDVKTLIGLLEADVPPSKVREAIKGFKDRLPTEARPIIARLEKNPLPVLKELEDELLHKLSKATHLYGGVMKH